MRACANPARPFFRRSISAPTPSSRRTPAPSAHRAALALLLGRPPEGFDVAAADLETLTIPDVAPGLPAELLVRRPDVVTAEANLDSAHANVAAARAAFFPTISLTGSGGLASAVLTGLITNPTASFSFGASLALFGARSAWPDQAAALAGDRRALQGDGRRLDGPCTRHDAGAEVESAPGDISGRPVSPAHA